MAWSPSSVRDFQLCPRLWWLKRQRVQERSSSVWSPGNLCGVAFHKGMEALICGGNGDVESAVYSVLDDWPVGVEGMGDAGKRIVRGAIAAKLEMPFVTETEHVLGCEVMFGDNAEEAARHGRYPGTADLITEDADGIIVTDYKTHYKREAKYSDEELRETQRSWQLKQYAWFAQEKYQKQVTRVRKILVYFTPVLKVWSYTHTLKNDELANWYAQATELWMTMDAMNALEMSASWQNGDACERFSWQWRCSMYSYCWDGEEIHVATPNH